MVRRERGPALETRIAGCRATTHAALGDARHAHARVGRLPKVTDSSLGTRRDVLVIAGFQTALGEPGARVPRTGPRRRRWLVPGYLIPAGFLPRRLAQLRGHPSAARKPRQVIPAWRHLPRAQKQLGVTGSVDLTTGSSLI